MCGAGREIERAGHQNEPRAHERHGAKLLDEPDVKADGDADLPPRGIKHGKVIAGQEGIGLHKALTAGNVDIKQMHLAVLCDLLTLGREDEAGIIDVLSSLLRYGTADEVNAAVLCGFAKELPRFAALRLGIGDERRVFIGTNPHLRKTDHFTALRGGPAHHVLHGGVVSPEIRRHRQLTKAELHAASLLLIVAL